MQSMGLAACEKLYIHVITGHPLWSTIPQIQATNTSINRQWQWSNNLDLL